MACRCMALVCIITLQNVIGTAQHGHIDFAILCRKRLQFQLVYLS